MRPSTTCLIALVALLNAVAELTAEPPRDQERASQAVRADQEFVPAPLSPRQAIGSFRLPDGFEIQLVAAEPLVVDPVAFEWGMDGRLWVAEMGDYPSNTEGSGGRVRFLEDRDGDGRYDHSTIFLDGLNFPNGVMPWRDGVLITAAPDILYAVDQDGDGRADMTRVLYSGFREGNQQHRVNGFVWGLDNWLHAAQGDSGGIITSTLTGEQTDLAGRDFAIHPDSGALRLVSGRTQFGRRRDDAGNWFGSNNSRPMFHYVLPDNALKRNPLLRIPSAVVEVPDQPGAAPCYPLSRPLARFNDFDRLNRFTSACSAMVYRDSLFPEDYRNSSYVSEPVHNLIHREQLRTESIVFHSRRAESESRSEFVASTDNWFRPTMLKTGPDGALWVADMYRLVIEHPEYIPPVLQAKWDLRAGSDRGRIYRIVPTAAKLRPLPAAKPEDRMPRQLVAQLESPSGWRRDTAQRLLVEQRPDAAIEPLRALIRQSTQPLARMHALCTLDGLQKLQADDVIRGLQDSDPRVVRHAIRLAESFADHDGVRPLLSKLVDHLDAFVQMQLALTLGNLDDDQSAVELGQLLVRHQSDQWLRYAVFSSLNRANCATAVTAALQTNQLEDPAAIEPLMDMVSRMDQPQLVQMLLSHYLKQAADAPRNQKDFTLLGRLIRSAEASGLDAIRSPMLAEPVKKLRQIARETIESGPEHPGWQEALALVPRGRDSAAEWPRLLEPFLSARYPSSVQQAVLRTLGEMPLAEAREMLIRQLATGSPETRQLLAEILLSRDEAIRIVLERMELGNLSPDVLPLVSQQQLSRHRQADIRERAEKLFSHGRVTQRAELVKELLPQVSEHAGDETRGRLLFEKNCGSCHRLRDIGKSLGPDLAALSNRSTENLLVAILDPNRAVESRYQSYTALTVAGQTISGLVSEETSTGVTLIPATGEPVTVLRTELEELACNQLSFMPEGLEKTLSTADLADVIAFVAATRAPLKSFAGNEPSEILPNDDGHFILAASRAEIRGSTLVFEALHQNLGYWGSTDDSALWTMQIPHSGRYHVILEYACPAGSGGNLFEIQLGDQVVRDEVVPTGSWDEYVRLKLTDLELGPGPLTVEMRAKAPLRNYLLDLKALHLIPKRR